MLSGLLKCGKCGATMISTKKTSKGKEYRYYVCQMYHKYGRDKCPQENKNAEQLEDIIIKSFTEELLRRLKNNENLNHNIQYAIENRLQDIEEKIQRVQKDTLTLIKKSDVLSEEQFEFANNQFRKELDMLLKEKERLTQKLISSKQLEDFSLALNAIKSDNKCTMKEYLNAFIKEIIVNDKNVHISYNYK